MTLPSLRLALLAGLLLPLGFATSGLAQPPPPAPPAEHPHDHPWAGGEPAGMRAHMAEHLTAVLQLQPSQQGALMAFLDAMRPPGEMRGPMEGPMGGMHGERGEMAELSTPERLDRMLAHLDEMRARMAQHVQATKQFYAQLTPSQQRAFDALAPMMMGHMGGGEGMMGSEGGAGPPDDEMGPDDPPPG